MNEEQKATRRRFVDTWLAKGAGVSGLDEQFPAWRGHLNAIAEMKSITELHAGQREMAVAIRVGSAQNKAFETHPLAFLLQFMRECISRLAHNPYLAEWLQKGEDVAGLSEQFPSWRQHLVTISGMGSITELSAGQQEMVTAVLR